MSTNPEFYAYFTSLPRDSEERAEVTNQRVAAAAEAWEFQQAKIDKLKHDLANEKCASQLWEASYKALTKKNEQREVSV